MASQIAGHRWDTQVEACMIGDTVDRRTFNLAQARDKLSGEAALVVHHCAHSNLEVALASAIRREGGTVVIALFAAQPLQVANHADQTGQAFVILRPRFPAIWRVI